MIRVLIVDDQKLVRDGHKALLWREEDMEVVGEAADGLEAVERAQGLSPDVVTMDIKMPRLDGLEATRQICTAQNHARIVVVAGSWDQILIRQAMQAGANGYVAKTDMRELGLAIRTVHGGKGYFSTRISDSLSHLSSTAPSE